MKIKIEPKNLGGSISVISSKSLTHRAIFAACLSEQVCVVKNVVNSFDVVSTLRILKTLNINFTLKDGELKVFGCFQNLNNQSEVKLINCGESGSSLRFLVPILAGLKLNFKLTGSKKLIYRFKKTNNFLKCNISQNQITLTNKIYPGVFIFRNCLTSQFITGLLLILPILKQNSVLIFKQNLESSQYVYLTINFLKHLNIKITKLKNGFKIYGNQHYDSFNYEIEPDYSQAAFFSLLGCFKKIELENLNLKSSQNDKIIFRVLKKCGTSIIFNKNLNKLVVKPFKENLKFFKFNVSNNVDLAPVLSILACFCEGTSKLTGTNRLHLKESDRVVAIVKLIKNLGGKIRWGRNFIKIKGGQILKGGVVDSFSDHRIAMAASVASIFCKKAIILNGAENVFKSYPKFFSDFKKLGGCFSVIDLE